MEVIVFDRIMVLDNHELTLCVIRRNSLTMALQSGRDHHKCKQPYMYPDNWFRRSCIVCHHMPCMLTDSIVYNAHLLLKIILSNLSFLYCVCFLFDFSFW